MDRPPIYIGCGCVVADGAGRYLLVRETKPIARGRLALPAGKLEPDESIIDGAIREVREETGYEVAPLGLLGIFHCARTSENSYGLNFVYEARVIGGALRISEEHPEVVWLARGEIEAAHAAGGVRGTHVLEAIERAERHEYLDAQVITEVLAGP